MKMPLDEGEDEGEDDVLAGSRARACIAIHSGANIAIIVMNGCRAVASNRLGVLRQNATPSAVMMTLTKTRP